MSHEMEIVAAESDASSVTGIALPAPREAITIRLGTVEDIPFLDSLQKLHTKQVGWMPTAQFEGKIRAGHVLIAEENAGGGVGLRVGVGLNTDANPDPTHTRIPTLTHPSLHPVGYVIGNDQYFKHDDIGIIYQLNV